MKECTDQQLIEKLQGGENAALNELMSRYKHRIFAFIRRYVGDEDVAYDLVQETFTKLYFSAATYKPEYRFSTWLFQIALNLCRDHGRKKKLAQFFSMDDEDSGFNFADAAPDPEALAQSNQAVLHINRSVESLPHKLKTALILYALEDRRQDECAELLGVTAKTVETRAGA